MNQDSARAEYDSEGNIILHPENRSSGGKCAQKGEWSWEKKESPWEIIETEKEAEKPEKQINDIPKRRHEKAAPTELKNTIKSSAGNFASEGMRQFKSSWKDAGTALGNAKSLSKKTARAFGIFLLQPVFIPGRNKKVKKYSRITLFLLDSARFGSTFAAIFTALFIALNYQSFWSIAKTRINPVAYVRNVQALTATVDSALKDKLSKIPSLAAAGGKEGSLLAFLPNVGPPENRLIIPKLGLNVPLVTPSYDALLREDWAQVEKDIQDALQMGVVHYPGTAKPGQTGNFFVTGHSSYYPWAPGKYKTVFARLQELEIGDEYWVYYGGDKFRYVIRSKKEVKPSDVTVLDQPLDRRISTLMTCVPVGTTLRRLIIVAEEVDPETGIPLGIGERPSDQIPISRPELLPI